MTIQWKETLSTERKGERIENKKCFQKLKAFFVIDEPKTHCFIRIQMSVYDKPDLQDVFRKLSRGSLGVKA